MEIRGFTVIRHREQGRRRKALGRDAIALPRALVTTEVEELVLFDWAADSSPELILLQHLLLRPALRIVTVIKEIVRVELLIAEELEKRSVDLIGPRFGHDIYIGACRNSRHKWRSES